MFISVHGSTWANCAATEHIYCDAAHPAAKEEDWIGLRRSIDAAIGEGVP